MQVIIKGIIIYTYIYILYKLQILIISMIFLCPTEKLHSHVTKGFLATFPPEHSILSMNAYINQVLNFS